MNDDSRELLHVADRLRKERPRLTELELDDVKTRAMRRAGDGSPRLLHGWKGRLMPRFAIMGMLVAGVLALLSGATVMQLDGGDASEAQYHTEAAGFPASDYVIDMSGGFPQDLTITAGQSVLWVNDTSEVHTVTKGPGDDAGPGPFFDSGPLAPGEFYLQAFDVAGEVNYFSETDVGEPDEEDWKAKVTVLPAD